MTWEPYSHNLEAEEQGSAKTQWLRPWHVRSFLTFMLGPKQVAALAVPN